MKKFSLTLLTLICSLSLSSCNQSPMFKAHTSCRFFEMPKNILEYVDNAEHIFIGKIKDFDLLHEIIESLLKETNAAPFEMTFYIGACPSKEKLIVDPNLLTNSYIWNNTITKKKKKTYVDIRFAIFNALVKEIVDPNNIYFDSTDTTEDEKYFSDLGAKPGKNLVCAVYTDEEV